MYKNLILAFRQVPVPMHMSSRRSFNATDIISITLFILVLATGTVGNGAVIYFFVRKSDRPGMRFTIILAAVDMLASTWVPFTFINKSVWKIDDYLGEFVHCPYGKVGCNIIQIWYVSLMYISSWLLAAICLERVR